MNAPVASKARMNVDEFLAWAAGQPGGRYELVDGEAVAMSPERVLHNLVKLAVATALREAVIKAGAPCTVFTDGIAVVINDRNTREPDASVQCDVDVNLESMTLTSPTIVVEVVSPSSERLDSEIKLVDYFSVASIQHYLIILTDRRAVVHHQRNAHGSLDTRIAHDGDIALNPPGISVSVTALLGPSPQPGTA